MFQGSHMVMVSVHGLPSVVNMNSLDYPTMVQSGNYVPAISEPVSKREAEAIKDELLQEFPDTNE